MALNPFFELYVGDRIPSEEFVTIFSPFLVQHSQSLFLPGNVVVTGTQGSGKSMLLSLLKPDVRLEYARSAPAKFPVAKHLRKFVGAGINLTHANAIDFGYRRFQMETNEISILFGDFVNYAVSLDLLESIRKFAHAGADAAPELKAVLDQGRQDALVRRVRTNPAWCSYLAECNTLPDIRSTIQQRLTLFRRFLHMNVHDFPEEIRQTKTDVGVPISALVYDLQQAGVIASDVRVFIHVDQYEELANITPSSSEGVDYRAVINRALARRDPLVSYRIGTRGHAWHNHGVIFGAEAKLEEERDYKFIDLDEKLRRYENRKTWIFPGFAADVFARRLKYAELTTLSDGRALLKSVFGSGMSPEEKASRYAGKNSRRVVKVDEDWPDRVKESLLKLAETDPLGARLGEAWLLQKGQFENLARQLAPQPWNEERRQWWRKERIELALVQIAGRCQQRPIWCGHEEIVDLSGGNILIFLGICQLIWDAWIQVELRNTDKKQRLSKIDADVQAIGVIKSSEYWLKKISQETGRSGDRLRFIRYLGNSLSRDLLADRKLSNPGHNGFSIADEELDDDPKTKAFLEELSDYGNLLVLRHTTKERDRRSRRKWYLNPILCPQFKIPYKRLKEPRYVRVADIRSWIERAGVGGRTTPVHPSHNMEQLPLFRTS